MVSVEERAEKVGDTGREFSQTGVLASHYGHMIHVTSSLEGTYLAGMLCSGVFPSCRFTRPVVSYTNPQDQHLTGMRLISYNRLISF
jgi:hypothetical protein